LAACFCLSGPTFLSRRDFSLLQHVSDHDFKRFGMTNELGPEPSRPTLLAVGRSGTKAAAGTTNLSRAGSTRSHVARRTAMPSRVRLAAGERITYPGRTSAHSGRDAGSVPSEVSRETRKANIRTSPRRPGTWTGAALVGGLFVLSGPRAAVAFCSYSAVGRCIADVPEMIAGPQPWFNLVR
jgi:hypothetical protein